jgi:hypothetical protein
VVVDHRLTELFHLGVGTTIGGKPAELDFCRIGDGEVLDEVSPLLTLLSPLPAVPTAPPLEGFAALASLRAFELHPIVTAAASAMDSKPYLFISVLL